jgi:hypothetical protein
MIYKIEDVREMPLSGDGNDWQIAKPYHVRFIHRIIAAWAVLVGRAFACYWR